MKKYLLPFIFIALFSCQNELDLEGNWIIIEMAHYGERVYPETISLDFKAEMYPTGYEGSEKIKFDLNDSTAVFPGFQSEVLHSSFSIRNDSIFFKEKERISQNGKEYLITKRAFLRDFEIVKESEDGYLRLKSDLTIIRLFDEDYLYERRFDNLFGK